MITILGLLLVVAIAWAYILSGAGMHMSIDEMAPMSSDEGMNTGLGVMQPMDWTFGYALLIFFMWWIMMAAMMLPSAIPIILLVAALNRKAQPNQAPYGASGLFAAGYLVAWAFFSLIAVGAQWALTESGFLSATMHSTSTALGGALLIAAGLWQFTPMKHACLWHCRSPLGFLLQHNRKGNAGSLLMGTEHGAYCLGCCWFLMVLLFVGGVMNLYWIIGLAVYVLGEKILPAGQWISRIAGAVLVIWGLAWIGGLI